MRDLREIMREMPDVPTLEEVLRDRPTWEEIMQDHREKCKQVFPTRETDAGPEDA